MKLHELLPATLRLALAALIVAATSPNPPAHADEPCDFASISISTMGCGLRDDGSLKCWGVPIPPFHIDTPGTFTQVSAGAGHACAIRASDSTLDCWGWVCSQYQIHSQLVVLCGGYSGGGDGPISPPAGAFAKVSAGGTHDCALRADGSIACWGGSNRYGESTVPAGTYTDVSALQDATCATTTAGELRCWGRNSATTLIPPAPDSTPHSGLSQASSSHQCALHGTDAVCWGTNTDGQTGAPAGAFDQLTAFTNTSCGLRPDGSVECWGSDTNNDASPPAEVFTQISRDCGLLADGTMTCWGRNAATLCSSCGNAEVGTGEECDDGNPTNGDGCDTNCTITACGNRIVTSGEACDDGNDVNSDGCDNDCTFGTVVCGDGIDAASEGCDDGNLIDGDGCDADCTVPLCGNGTWNWETGEEECDDGNIVSGDGCSAECLTECPAEASSTQYACWQAPRAALNIKDAADDKSDSLIWQWKNGSSVSYFSERFNLCLYRGQGLLTQSVVANVPSEQVSSEDGKWAYSDREGAIGGIRSLKLQSNSKDLTTIRLKAKGAAMPDSLVPATSYTVRIILPGSDVCWESQFASGTSTDTSFKAKFEE